MKYSAHMNVESKDVVKDFDRLDALKTIDSLNIQILLISDSSAM
jgi:hypothetical protein